MNFVLFLIVLTWAQPDNRPDEASGYRQPQPLKAMEASRQSLSNGRLEVRVYTNMPQLAEPARVRRYSYRWVGNDYICSELGNDAGVIHIKKNGTPIQATWTYTGPTSHLMQPGRKYWKHVENAPLATVYLSEPGGLSGTDPRAIGLTTRPPLDGRGLHEIVAKFGEDTAIPRSFSVRKIDRLVEVTATRDDQWTETVRLDPTRGWNPVRIVTELPGKNRMHGCTIDLEQHGDIWFPKKVSYFNVPDWSGDPWRTLEVTKAVFNEKNIRGPLTPEDIGIGVGTQINLVENWLTGRPPASIGFQHMAWDGKEISPGREVFRRIESGDLKLGPNMQALYESQGVRLNQPRAPEAQQPTTRLQAEAASKLEPVFARVLPLDVWDQYVDGVAKISELDTIQKNSAQGILRDVRQRAIAKDDATIATLFEELRLRIDAVLTPEQRKRDGDSLERARLARHATAPPAATKP